MGGLPGLAGSLTLAFGWDPEIRGILFVAIAVVTLCGSVYLLLATNTGARLGFLIALTGLFGWMFLMGAIWWVYGIGLRGEDPTWEPKEVVVGDLAQAAFPEAQTLDGWTELPADDPGRGQAQASADEILVTEAEVFESSSDYLPVAVFDRGGETGPWFLFNIFHEPHYALVQVQAVVAQETEPGQAPPSPVIDEEQPVVNVLMVRDLGTRRRPPALITIGSLIIFIVLCWMLHTRDRASAAARGVSVERAPRG